VVTLIRFAYQYQCRLVPSSLNMGAKGEKVTQLHVMNHKWEEKGKGGSDENAWKHNDEIEIFFSEI
jgi:hypothetical protein